MSGSRRRQRSVRLTAASSLLFLSTGIVAVAVATSLEVSAAAVFAAVAGMVATRMGYAEVMLARKLAAIDRTAQARAFGAALTRKQQEHTAFTQAMAAKLQGQQRTLVSLERTVRLAEQHADDAVAGAIKAEQRVDAAETRAQREAQRANEAQDRLSSLLDEVLRPQALTVVVSRAAAEEGREEQLFDSADLPPIIDMLAWEDQANASSAEGRRRRA